MGLAHPLWNFTELQSMLDAKCENTLMPLSELFIGNDFDVYLSLNLPW